MVDNSSSLNRWSFWLWWSLDTMYWTLSGIEFTISFPYFLLNLVSIEKIYQTPNIVFDQISKYLKVCQKCDPLHIVSCISTFFSVFGNGFKHSFCLIHIMPIKNYVDCVDSMNVRSSSCCPFVVYWLPQSLFSYQHHLKKFTTHMYLNRINFDVVYMYVNIIAIV